MERKPISLEKEKFDASPEMDYYPLHYDDWININVEEKNEIVPSYDNSDNFWDEYIKKINRIQGALAYISNNSDCIRDNPGYIQLSSDAADFCSSMIKKISTNDRVISNQAQQTEHYLEQTEIIVKYIEHKINVNASYQSQQTAMVKSTDSTDKKEKSILQQIFSPGICWILLLTFTIISLYLYNLFHNVVVLDSFFEITLFLFLFLFVIYSFFYIPYIINKFIFKVIKKIIKDLRQ